MDLKMKSQGTTQFKNLLFGDVFRFDDDSGPFMKVRCVDSASGFVSLKTGDITVFVVPEDKVVLINGTFVESS